MNESLKSFGAAVVFSLTTAACQPSSAQETPPFEAVPNTQESHLEMTTPTQICIETSDHFLLTRPTRVVRIGVEDCLSLPSSRPNDFPPEQDAKFAQVWQSYNCGTGTGWFGLDSNCPSK
ncbi:MAG: hypothetical protein WCW30_01225 [Candidatus Gracilibacteria bacterium]